MSILTLKVSLSIRIRFTNLQKQLTSDKTESQINDESNILVHEFLEDPFDVRILQTVYLPAKCYEEKN